MTDDIKLKAGDIATLFWFREKFGRFPTQEPSSPFTLPSEEGQSAPVGNRQTQEQDKKEQEHAQD